MYVLSASNQRVSVELLGKDKIQDKLSRFEELNSASISYLGVTTPGDPAEICASVPNLKELDLTGNLISDWKDVGTICEQLPHLVALNLSNNLMTQNLIGLPLLKGIRVLVLNSTGINWSQVEILEHSLPVIEELHLMGNKISAIKPTSSSTVQGFDSLRLLNLEDNCLTEWNEILKLSQLKSLEQLYLNKNKLNSIFYPDKNKILELLANQESWSNEISDLASIDSLNSFPKLIDIRLSENPIAYSRRGGLLRFALIARLAKVEMLNGSKGSPLPVLLDDEMDIGIGNDSTIIVDEESSLSYFGARKKYTNTDDGCNLFLKWLSKESSTVDHCKSTLN
ncbi:PFIFFERLING, TUBULIN-FOLDING COFACTOR E [Hibiscus trionum]|uniref:PFIFFERLING, TUBULIN-FOLDING COFACTOR E n=1 Tax=Hibiscus trionum TaxID=183268 RepID=A0A9W7HYQ1_HIBTR|nr:PFIFFERLING, TUBULIN-FOLDING COFACTOR E [Hibiscus trionum]